MPSSNGSFAGDMTRLKWDPELAQAAQGWVNHLCSSDYFAKDTNECRRTEKYSSVGQNLYLTWGQKYANESNIAQAAVNYWYVNMDVYRELFFNLFQNFIFIRTLLYPINNLLHTIK